MSGYLGPYLNDNDDPDEHDEATCYVLSVYEPADEPGRDGEFVEVGRAATLFALRAAIREVRKYYDSVSYAIDRHPC